MKKKLASEIFDSSLRKTYEEAVFDPYTCHLCGRKLSPWINPKTGKMEKYLWYCYKCRPKCVLSIG